MYFPRTKMLREEFEYTQEYVAKYLGCSRSTYANWESGNIILPLDIADKLSKLYNVSLSFVLGIGTTRFYDKKLKNINYNYLKEKLNELKNESNDSFEKISRYINTDKSTTNRYFNGKIKIPTDKLILLCEYYNIEIDDLCGIK